MFILYGILFLGSFYLFGLAFSVEEWQGLIFIAGVLAFSLALGVATRPSRK